MRVGRGVAAQVEAVISPDQSARAAENGTDDGGDQAHEKGFSHDDDKDFLGANPDGF